jgi:hypothetical protein
MQYESDLLKNNKTSWISRKNWRSRKKIANRTRAFESFTIT